MIKPTGYSLGFMFDSPSGKALLIKKNKPAFLRGQWAGIGGHIEPGETPMQAMLREFEEECGVKTNEKTWGGEPYAVVEGDSADGESYLVHVYRADSPLVHLARTTTSEDVFAWKLPMPPGPCLTNLSSFLLPMALDRYVERARIVTHA